MTTKKKVTSGSEIYPSMNPSNLLEIETQLSQLLVSDAASPITQKPIKTAKVITAATTGCTVRHEIKIPIEE